MLYGVFVMNSDIKQRPIIPAANLRPLDPDNHLIQAPNLIRYDPENHWPTGADLKKVLFSCRPRP